MKIRSRVHDSLGIPETENLGYRFGVMLTDTRITTGNELLKILVPIDLSESC